MTSRTTGVGLDPSSPQIFVGRQPLPRSSPHENTHLRGDSELPDAFLPLGRRVRVRGTSSARQFAELHIPGFHRIFSVVGEMPTQDILASNVVLRDLKDFRHVLLRTPLLNEIHISSPVWVSQLSDPGAHRDSRVAAYPKVPRPRNPFPRASVHLAAITDSPPRP